MNCIKSIYILRDFGTIRLTMFSIFAMLSFFSVFYSTFMIMNPHIRLSVFQFMPLFSGLLLIYPVHKMLHCLPIWMSGNSVKVSINIKSNGCPILYCDVHHALSRNMMISAVSFPGMIITLAVLVGASVAPQYVHYFSFIGAINFGLSVTDFIYFSFLLRTPAHACIEDFRDGFHVLIRNANLNI